MMDTMYSSAVRRQIEADLEHLQLLMRRIEDTVYLTADDMRLRRSLRWAIARKRRILDRLASREQSMPRHTVKPTRPVVAAVA